MITADFLTAVYDIIGDPAGDRSALVKRVANRELKELARKYKCNFMLTTGTLSVTDGTYEYNMPEDYYKPYLAYERTNDEILGHTSIKEIEKLYPNPSDITEDVPTDYAIIGLSWVAAQPTSSSALAISSTSSETCTLSIYGTSGGVLKSETVTMAGTSATSTNSYTNVKYIALGSAATGTLTITSNSSAVTVLSLLPGQKYKEFYRVRVYPTPDSSYTLYFRYYRIPQEVSNNSDIIMIPDAYVDWLIEQTSARILELDGQKNAQTHFALAQNVLNDMIQDEIITEDEESYSWLYNYPNVRIF